MATLPSFAPSPAGGPRVFPLNAVVGQEAIRRALVLLAVDPHLGGIVIAGRRGTAKSVLARALHALLPPIRVIRHSCCNADPANPSDWDDATWAHRATISRTPVSILRPAPFVQVPLGVSEDRLLGSVDVSASIRRGRPVFQPGLLAEAHRGVLYIDELNLLDPGLANLLFTVVDGGINRVEREGISFQHPCRPLLIATYNPAEGGVRAHLIDRLALVLSADTPLSLDERVEAVERVLEQAADPGAFWQRHGPGQLDLQRHIAAARRLLGRVSLTPPQVRYLVEEAIRAGVEGHRGDLFAMRLARVQAALEGRRQVEAADLRLAVELALLVRPQRRPWEAEARVMARVRPVEFLKSVDQACADRLPFGSGDKAAGSQTSHTRTELMVIKLHHNSCHSCKPSWECTTAGESGL